MRATRGGGRRLGREAQGALDVGRKGESPEEPGWIEVVLSRLVNHAGQIIRSGFGVFHDGV